MRHFAEKTTTFRKVTKTAIERNEREREMNYTCNAEQLVLFCL